MIAHLKGTILQKRPTELIVEVNGIGYQINVPLSTYEKLQNATGEVTILTHLHVREDLVQLFGFATEAERELFRLLLAVSGVGPKLAQSILSGISPTDLREAILGNNLVALTSISGIGTKTAERIILELRHKLGKLEIPEPTISPTSQQLKSRSEALVALMSLGHTRASAEKAIRDVLAASQGRDYSVEELIKLALHHTSKK